MQGQAKAENRVQAPGGIKLPECSGFWRTERGRLLLLAEESIEQIVDHFLAAGATMSLFPLCRLVAGAPGQVLRQLSPSRTPSGWS